MNKKIIGVLVAIIIILVAALVAVVLPKSSEPMNDITTTETTETNQKWVLVNEKDIDPVNSEISYEAWYEYDEQGRMIKSYDTNATESIDFVYDDNGNVISKNVSEFYYGTRVKTNYVYKYDEADNCIEKIITYSDGGKNIYKYEYDEYGNLLSEINERNGTINSEKTIDSVYDGNLIIEQKFFVIDGPIDYTYYQINEYDDNNNLIKKKCYVDFAYSDEKITVNGVEYSLQMITEYTYESIDVVSDSKQSNVISEQTTEPTTTPKKLSDECDEVLATGTNSNGDYYEVVANKVEDYTGLSVYVGVIKNNEWLLEPTKDMPFVLNGYGFKDNGPTSKVHYVGNNCFLAEISHRSNKYSPVTDYLYIAYNVETGKSYSASGTSEIPLICSEKDEHMIIGYDGYAGETVFYILNKRDMTVSDVRIEGYRNSFANISEGVFSVALGESNYPKHYIYDINGKIVLDLSEYKTYGHQNVYFIDGKCNLEIINNNDTKYRLTINKKGEVLDSEVVYE